ncbi:MAG TPA: IS5/IS1182 family transposase, partial [Sutterellaceae bacterium]|nr:IS5/IS1182 family transposase [Sutterellaceae bacterium]
NVHDVTKADALRRPDDREVIGDSGYLGMEKRESADPEHVTYTAAKRYSQTKKLSAERVADEKVL